MHAEPLFKVEARLTKPHSSLHIPGGNVWVTVCRGRLHTIEEGEAAVRAFIRDFKMEVQNLRLVLATAAEREEWAAFVRDVRANAPSITEASEGS